MEANAIRRYVARGLVTPWGNVDDVPAPSESERGVSIIVHDNRQMVSIRSLRERVELDGWSVSPHDFSRFPQNITHLILTSPLRILIPQIRFSEGLNGWVWRIVDTLGSWEDDELPETRLITLPNLSAYITRLSMVAVRAPALNELHHLTCIDFYACDFFDPPVLPPQLERLEFSKCFLGGKRGRIFGRTPIFRITPQHIRGLRILKISSCIGEWRLALGGDEPDLDELVVEDACYFQDPCRTDVYDRMFEGFPSSLRIFRIHCCHEVSILALHRFRDRNQIDVLGIAYCKELENCDNSLRRIFPQADVSITTLEDGIEVTRRVGADGNNNNAQ